MAALCGCLVDADTADIGVVGAATGLLDPVVQHTPHPGVVLAHQARSRSDRHRRHQRHGERLEQQREAGVGSGRPCAAWLRHDGTAICLTPQSGHVTRGVRECRNA